MNSLLDKNEKACSGNFCETEWLSIELKKNVKPHNTYYLSKHDEEMLEPKIKELLEKNYIQYSKSSYNNPLFAKLKENGDYRILNNSDT